MSGWLSDLWASVSKIFWASFIRLFTTFWSKCIWKDSVCICHHQKWKMKTTLQVFSLINFPFLFSRRVTKVVSDIYFLPQIASTHRSNMSAGILYIQLVVAVVMWGVVVVGLCCSGSIGWRWWSSVPNHNFYPTRTDWCRRLERNYLFSTVCTRVYG